MICGCFCDSASEGLGFWSLLFAFSPGLRALRTEAERLGFRSLPRFRGLGFWAWGLGGFAIPGRPVDQWRVWGFVLFLWRVDKGFEA